MGQLCLTELTGPAAMNAGRAHSPAGANLRDSASDVHLVLAPADVAWKSLALRNAFRDPRWVPNPTRQSRCGRALELRQSRESEVAANETHAAGGVAVLVPDCDRARPAAAAAAG